MKKFVRVSSQPTFIPMLGNKMKSQTEDDPEKSLNIDTQPQKKLALFLKHTLMNILMRKKNQGFQQLLKRNQQHTNLIMRVKKFLFILQAYQKKQKQKCMVSLHVYKIKFHSKIKSCMLVLNFVKRSSRRKKMETFAWLKSIFLRDMRIENGDLEQRNSKYGENSFSDSFIRQVRKLTRFSPQTNLGVYTQAIQQNLQPLLSLELLNLQNQRRKRNQPSDSEIVINVMSSSTITMLNLYKNNKILLEEIKHLKGGKNILADLEAIVEHFKKLDVDLGKKADIQLKKVIENQLKISEKKKNINYLYESRFKMLELFSKYLVSGHKIDHSTEVFQKLEVLSNSCCKVPELEIFKSMLKPGVNFYEKYILNVVNTLLNLYRRELQEVAEEDQNNNDEIIEEILNLGQALQRIIKGKLYEGKKPGWKNLFKRKQGKYEEVNILYNSVEKLFQIIEKKEKKIEEISFRENPSEDILKGVVQLMSCQDYKKAQKQWLYLQEKYQNEQLTFKKINKHFYYVAVLQDEDRSEEYKEKIKQLNTLTRQQSLQIQNKESQIQIIKEELQQEVSSLKFQLEVHEESLVKATSLQSQLDQKEEQLNQKELFLIEKEQQLNSRYSEIVKKQQIIELKFKEIQKYKIQQGMKEQMALHLKTQLEKKDQLIKYLSEAVETLSRVNEEKERKIKGAKHEYNKFKTMFRSHEEQTSERKKELSSIMKSPKSAKANNPLRSFPNMSTTNLSSSESQTQLIKEQNRRLSQEVVDLRNSLQQKQPSQFSIEVENMMKLIYNIITISSRTPNESLQAVQIWEDLNKIVKQFHWSNPIEGLIKTEQTVISWISRNVFKCFRDKIQQKDNQIREFLEKINELEEDENEKTPKRKYDPSTCIIYQQTSQTQKK